MQVALWLAAIVIAARVRVSVGRREPLLLADETLIDLTGDAVPSLVDPGLVPEPEATPGVGGESEAEAPEHGCRATTTR